MSILPYWINYNIFSIFLTSFCRSIRSTFPIPVQHDLIISAKNRQTHNLINESKTKTNSGIKTVEACDSYKRCNIYTSCSINSSCPPHIARSSDGEFGREHYHNEINQQVSVKCTRLHFYLEFYIFILTIKVNELTFFNGRLSIISH